MLHLKASTRHSPSTTMITCSGGASGAMTQRSRSCSDSLRGYPTPAWPPPRGRHAPRIRISEQRTPCIDHQPNRPSEEHAAGAVHLRPTSAARAAHQQIIEERCVTPAKTISLNAGPAAASPWPATCNQHASGPDPRNTAARRLALSLYMNSCGYTEAATAPQKSVIHRVICLN